MASSETREAQRAARKRRILENRNDRMSKVKGEYNQHRIADSEDEDDDKLSRLLKMPEENYIMIEPADSLARIVIFILLAVVLLALEHYEYYTVSGLFYPYVCVQLALLSYMFTKGFLYRKMRPAPIWSKALILFGLPHEEAIRVAKYVVFAYNLFKDFLVMYFTYYLIMYFLFL